VWRLVGLLTATSVLTAACAGGGPDTGPADDSSVVDGSWTTEMTSTTVVTSSTSDQVGGDSPFEQLVAGLAGLAVSSDRAPALLVAGCDAWVPNAFQGDSASFNGGIYSLFSSGDADVSLSDLDVAITSACSRHRADPGAFVATVLHDLGLSVSDLLELVGDACDSYRQGRIANFDDPFAPEPLDPMMAAVLAAAGIGRADAIETVNDFCEVPDAESLDRILSVLPDPALTPGAVDPDFDVAAACVQPPPAPVIPREIADAVIDLYGDLYDVGSVEVEVQRLIPFELGGSTTRENLFPVPTGEHPGARDKPEVDSLVVELVCDGIVAVDDARNVLVIDWPIAYSTLVNR
jgi:hypothetical protein